MDIYKKINKMIDEPGTFEEKLYRILASDKYATGKYQKQSLGEGMEVINQVIWEWWKPRFLVNHNLQTAYEWMWGTQQLAIVDEEHIDWDSMRELPEDAMTTLTRYSFQYPSFIRGFSNGIAHVRWQLVPDGRYWIDDEGFGETNEKELNIYGFIDQEANIISKFHYYTDKELDNGALEQARKEAEQTLARRRGQQPPGDVSSIC